MILILKRVTFSDNEKEDKGMSTGKKLAIAAGALGIAGLSGYLLHKRAKLNNSKKVDIEKSNSNTSNKSRQISTAPKHNNDGDPKPKPNNNKSNSGGKDVYVKGGEYVDKNGNKLTRDEVFGNKNNRLIFE
jgi:hypothetical protein